MSKALSKSSSVRQSGNSLVITIPAEIVKGAELVDGDTMFWELNGDILRLRIVRVDDMEKIAT